MRISDWSSDVCSSDLPRPSNERAETPRKSRTRGSDTFTRLSRNSYILERRRVTLQPIGQPSRILNDATDTRDLVTIGFWPETFAMSATAFSSTFLLVAASPTPMLSVILDRRGTCIGLDRKRTRRNSST